MQIDFDVNLLNQALTAVLILIVTYVFGKVIARFFKETFKQAGIPETETIILTSIIQYSIYLIGISIALDHIGIPIISLWVALISGVIVLGVAARSAIDNIVSGYFLRTYGPFDVGDVIGINGKIGAVKDLTMLKTIMETPEHLVYSIPNSKVMQSKIYNFTRHKSGYPVNLVFEVSRDADLENFKLEILKTVSSYPKTCCEKPVQISVQRFTKKGIIVKLLFYVPSFEIKLGAKDYVASEIWKKSQKGQIPILQSSGSRPYSPNHSERMDLGEEKI